MSEELVETSFILKSETATTKLGTIRNAQCLLGIVFDSQINPVEIKVKRELIPFEKDEHPKTTTLEDLASLRPVFEKDGTVTAGNASGINDGAAAVTLMSNEIAEKNGIKKSF